MSIGHEESRALGRLNKGALNLNGCNIWDRSMPNIKDQTHLIFVGLIHYGSWTLDKLPRRSTLFFINDRSLIMIFFYHTLYVYYFQKKKTQVLLGLNMFLHLYDYLIQNSWIRKKCIFELKYFPSEVPNFYGFIRFNIFKNHHGEYIDIL